MNKEKLKLVFDELDAVCKKHGVRLTGRDPFGTPLDQPQTMMILEAEPKKARFNFELQAWIKHGYGYVRE